MPTKEYIEFGPRPGRVIEVAAIGDPEIRAGKVKVVPEDKGCSVDATVVTDEEKTTTHFVRSHIGKLPVPFFDARLSLAIEAAIINTEVASDVASVLPGQSQN